VLVVTKDLVGGATALAQGGLAAAIGPQDSAAAHAGDTLVAGAGLCEPEVVAELAAGAPRAIDWLAGLGARLETRELRLEGGHSHRRIVHSGDDATGAEVHRVLLAALLASGIEILDRTVALDLIVKNPAVRWAADGGRTGTGPGPRAMDGAAAATAAPDGSRARMPVSARAGTGGLFFPESVGRATGLLAGVIGPDGRLAAGVIDAPAVVIAAGGLGQAFATTSNPAGATGDGIAIAARAGAVLRDPEFVQFHPTVLWRPGASGQCPLITEALRGAGAVLRDLDGRPLMAGHDPRGDLAPRDVVAARMAEVIGAGDAGHVWLDATGIDAGFLETGFPTVLAACRKHGIDPVTEFIPVAPGAHYSCGGILAGLDGQTSVPGLYAVGEAASTGVQGANRLASNSVTEAILAGRRTGRAAAARVAGRVIECNGGARSRAESAVGGAITAACYGTPVMARNPNSEKPGGVPPALAAVMPGRAGVAGDPDAGGIGRAPGRSDAADGRQALALAMSRWAGVIRDREGLTELARVISATGGAVIAGGVLATGSETREGSREAACVPSADLAFELDLGAVEAANLRLVSGLIAAAALHRAESRGCHRRRDAAETAERPWHTLSRWDGREFAMAEEEV
jgi:L-aspartate oxidase